MLGQFRDLPIISPWGNMKMLPVSHKPIKTTQFFQNHGHSPHLCRSGCKWLSVITGRSPEVKWRHNPFFAKSRDRMEIGTRKLCKTTWLVELLQMMCILTYLGHDLILTYLTWSDLTSNLQIELKRSKNTWRGEHHGVFLFSYLLYKKVINEKPSSRKTTTFYYLWRQNYWP